MGISSFQPHLIYTLKDVEFWSTQHPLEIQFVRKRGEQQPECKQKNHDILEMELTMLNNIFSI